MAKKVEGWTTEWAVDDAIRNGSGIELRRSEIKPLSTVKATLVIGDERVFTESEVKAMMKDLDIAKENPGAFVRRRRGEPMSYWKAAANSYVLSKHGLSDPA